MNQRTKWLIFGAVAVFGLYSADQLYRRQIEQPTIGLTAELEGLNKKNQTNKESQAAARSNTRRLETYQERSLPYDPQLARSAYQDWLLDLVERHNIESAAVDAAQPRPVELRSRTDRRKRIKVANTIAFTLRGQASLAKWTQWLREFSSAGHLHKISGLTFNPLGSKGVLDATLTIEVLSLTTASRKDVLTNWQRVDSSQQSAEQALGQFVRRNLFAKGFAKSLYQIELKAITVDREGRSQAWFRIDEQGKIETLTVEQELPLQLHEITIKEILPDKVMIQLNGESYWMTLGQTVGQVCEELEQP